MTPEDENPTTCIRTDKPEGYITLYLTEGSRRSVDELIDHIKQIAVQVREAPDSFPPTVRILVDTTSGHTQPIAYLINRLGRERKNLVYDRPTKIAATFNSPMFIDIVRTVVYRVNMGRVRFRPVRVQDIDRAIEWLLADD